MQCVKCGTDNPARARFCLTCGEKLVQVCPKCGKDLPAGAKFCLACGAQVAFPEAIQLGGSAALTEAIQRLIPKELADRLLATRGQVSTERRQVTILFCDVKGSTAMGEDLDPEDMLEIVNGAFEVLIPPVYHYEGTVAQLLGDAIMAFFGAPIAHEDDPERAIRAALEITTEAQKYAERLRQERGIAGFGVRVGINTGLVVVGEVGVDLRVGYTAVGDTINVAARMEQNAPPGGILITHDTYRHVRGVFDVTPQPPLLVKGKSEPLQTYLVQRAKPRAWRIGTRGVEGIETRMVGREAELLILQNAYQDTVEDAETHVVTIAGEAGVGKSRLVDEFNNWVELRPETFYYFKGRATTVGQAVPYQLLRDLFAYRFDILDSDSAATALDKFRAGMAGILEPEKADLVGQLVGFDFAAAGSEAVRALLGSPNFAQLAMAFSVQYLRGLLARQPVVMLLEDLQWADDSSLDLVAYWVSEIPRAPWLVVAAARPGLYERRPNWGEGQEAYSQLDLKPLSKRATRALVEEILQKAQEVPGALRQLVVDGAEGNPYYVEELIKMLIEDGVIVRPSGALPGAEEQPWQIVLGRLAEVRVPPTLTGILQARLDILPAAERAVLQRAAVVGRLFWDSVVGELAADTEVGEVRPLLSALRERELVFQRERSAFAGTNEYTFKHTILRDVTYETVLLKLRRRYHAQVAQWLETHAGERLSEYLGLIAGHYELAGDTAKAAEYLRKSGDEARQISAYRDARAAYERALKLLPVPASADGSQAPRTEADMAAARQRAAILVQLGITMAYLSEYSTSRSHLQEGLALAQALHDPKLQALAKAGLCNVAFFGGRWEDAGSEALASLALAEECEAVSEQALAHYSLAACCWKRGDVDEGLRHAKESQRLSAQLADRQGMARALNMQGVLHGMRGEELDEARACYTESLALRQELGDRMGIAAVLNNLGELARKRGDFDEALVSYEQLHTVAAEVGSREGQCLALENMALVCAAQGREQVAWNHVRQSLQESAAIRSTPNLLWSVAIASWLRVRAGCLEQAAEWIGLVLNHPAMSDDLRRDMEPGLIELRAALSPEEQEAAMARGAKLDLDEVVGEILAQAEWKT